VDWTELVTAESHGVLLVGRNVMDGFAGLGIVRKGNTAPRDGQSSRPGGRSNGSFRDGLTASLSKAPISAHFQRTFRGAPSGRSNASGSGKLMPDHSFAYF